MSGVQPQNTVQVPERFSPAKAPSMREEFALRSDEKSPEQEAHEARLEREKQAEHNFAMAGVQREAGKIETGAGAVRAAQEDVASRQEKERREKTDTQVLLATLDAQIANMEGDLADRYGENFAENLFAELFENGQFEDEEYARIMAIEDPDERRRAIAAAIQQGIEEGRIGPADLNDHPWAQDWLALHNQAAEARDREVELGLRGELNADDMSVAARDEAKRNGIDAAPDQESSFEVATVQNERENEIDRAAAPALGGVGLGGV